MAMAGGERFRSRFSLEWCEGVGEWQLPSTGRVVGVWGSGSRSENMEEGGEGRDSQLDLFLVL